MELRTAKSCGPDISTPISGATRKRCHPRWQKQPDHRREHEAAVKTVAQETLGDPAMPVVTTLVCFIFCTWGCGRGWRPAFPSPSLSEGLSSHHPDAIGAAAM